MSFYGTVLGADQYHQSRGSLDWSGEVTPNKEAALLRASEYVDAKYRTAFMGYRTDGRSQAREWPRKEAYVFESWDWTLIPSDEIPDEIIRATYEAALREVTAPGSLTPDIVPGKTVKSASVDGAASVTYWSDELRPIIEKIGMILAPLIASDGTRDNPLSGKVAIR